MFTKTTRPFRCLASGLLLAFGLASAAHAVCLDPPGDLDGSGTTGVVDVQCSILLALWVIEGQTGPGPVCASADVSELDANCAGAFDISDILVVVQYALGATLPPSLDSDGDSCPDACETATCEGMACAPDAPEATCSDGLDNDEDGYNDCDDFDCNNTLACGGFGSESGEQKCADGIDNDGDSYVDCQDFGCANAAVCASSESTEES